MMKQALAKESQEQAENIKSILKKKRAKLIWKPTNMMNGKRQTNRKQNWPRLPRRQ